MSSSEAQKTPVHHSTEDSTAEPTNETGRVVVTPEGHPAGEGIDRAPDGDGGPGAAGAKAGPDDGPDRANLKPGKDPDESSYGGPLNLDDPNAV